MKRVLVACEYSGRVRQAFEDKGWDAWSCDLLPSEDNGHKHIQGDVLGLLEDSWDLLIAHPPCTYLAVSGMHWTTRGYRDPQLTEDALEFVQRLMDAPVERIAVENPISVISSRIRKPDQVVQPWMFGHNASKSTCLWLKGLPPLGPTWVVPPEGWGHGEGPHSVKRNGHQFFPYDGVKRPIRWANQTPGGQNNMGPSEDRWKERSRTYQGVALAMAQQWGNI